MEYIKLIILILHIVVACLLLGVAFFGLVAVFTTPLTPAQKFMFKTIHPFGRPLAGIQLILGLLLVYFDQKHFLMNPYIWAKLVLYVLSGYVAAVVIKKKLDLLESKKPNPALERSLTSAAWALFILVLAMVILGVVAVFAAFH